MKPPDLTIIGAGNVATHLAQAFSQAGCTIKQVYSPTPAHAEVLAKRSRATVAPSISAIEETDFLIIAVSDDAVRDVAGQLSLQTTMVVHTSGTVPMDALARTSTHYGVLYPLQSFSKDRPVNMQQVPLLLEANNDGGYNELAHLARRISGDIRKVVSRDRLKYHLSAVIANNFTNHLLREAHDYLAQNNLDFSVLQPLIRETVDKALELGPENAQTGPAKRNDQGTIQQHLDLLEGEELKALYQFLSRRIRGDQ